MLSVSEAYSRAINADTRRTFHRVTIAGVTLDQTAVPKMTFNESVGSNSGVALGTSNSASLQLTLKNPAVIDYTEMLVEPESGIELPDGTIEWLPLGKFWVTDSSTSNDYKTVNLTCADGMYLMSGEYVSALTYPALVRDVAHEIAEQAGVELVELEEWPEVYIRKKPEKLTLRNAIGYVAGCCGKNAKFNRYGKLEFVWYKDTGITIEREQQYLDGFTRLNDQPLDVNFEIKGEDEKYKVTVVSDNNGNVIATPGTNVLEGDTVTLSVVPFYGYELSVISATTTADESVTLWQNADGDEYTFLQPDSDVTVTVTFKEEGSEGEVIVNPPIGGEYSFLQHPSFASPPTSKPYWAIFYKHDTDVGPNAKYYLVWFDSWSLGDKIYLSGERRGYYLNIDGYYYCRGANNGRAQHYWDNAIWQGNGASGSPLSWRTGVGRWCDDYGLLASNISLYDGDTLFFENNESEIGTVQTSFLVNNVDVREKGVFNLYSCPDTYSTPLPGKHWMLTNKARVYKTGTDGEYEDLFSGSSYDPYILFFDGCVIQDIGKYYDFHEGNYLKITFSKLVVASYLNYKTFYYSNERTFNEECYIIISDPDYSSDYASGGGWEYPTGLYATNLSSSYFNNNSCMICDCVSTASEPMMFAMRRNVGATVTMEYTNPLITSKMVDSIAAVVQGVSYTPSKVKHRGNPALEAGDIVTVPDRDGNSHTVLIMQQTLTFGGGMNAVITCPGQTEKKTNFSATGALTTQIKQVVQEATSYQKRETDAYNSLLVSTMNRSMSSLSREVTQDGVEIKLLNEWRGIASSSLIELSTSVTEHGASLKSIVEWQDAANDRFSSIEQTVGSIDLSVYAKNADLQATNESVAQIRLDLDSIDLSVYATKSDLGDYAKTQEVSSALSMYAKTEDLNSYAKTESLDDYATKEAVREAIAGIDLSVSATNSQLETVKVQLNLAVLTDGEGNLESAIHIGADKLTIETDNFSLDRDGTMKAIQGEVASWQITPNTIYKEASNIFTGISSINKYARATEGLVYALNAEGTGYEVTGYTGTDTDVYIPSEYNSLPVTAIGNSAFSNNSTIKSITILDGITHIGNTAFEYCTNLTSVTIPSSVTSTGFSLCMQSFSATIYCEAKSKPSGWSTAWNTNSNPVVWGHSIENINAPRFFAGSKSNTPWTPDEADFLVFEDGTLFASKANISGVINAKSGYIGGWELGDMNLTYFQNSGLSSVESFEDSFAQHYKIHLTPKGLHLSHHYTGLSYRPEACITWGAICYYLWNAIKNMNGARQGVDYDKDEYFAWN